MPKCIIIKYPHAIQIAVEHPQPAAMALDAALADAEDLAPIVQPEAGGPAPGAEPPAPTAAPPPQGAGPELEAPDPNEQMKKQDTETVLITHIPCLHQLQEHMVHKVRCRHAVCCCAIYTIPRNVHLCVELTPSRILDPVQSAAVSSVELTPHPGSSSKCCCV